MNTPVIFTDKLSKNYGSLSALKSLSFQVGEGQCVGLLGPNGAGKSTTIQILLGWLKPSSGKAQILGLDPSLNPKDIHSFAGYVPDHLSLYEDLTVEQNIEFFRRIYNEPPERAQTVIKKMELTEKAKTRARHLSKGLKQRLLIARSIVHVPKVLLLDEPTVALDPASTDFVCSFFEELKQQGVTMLLSSHLMSLAERLCDHIIFLNKGEKVEDSPLFKLRQKYGQAKIEVKFIEGEEQKTVFVPLGDKGAEELAKLQKSKKIISINSKEAGLEDIFIRLVKERR